MPNITTNILKMKGLKDLPLFTLDNEGRPNFDFNKIIPMPETLNIEAGSMTEECIVYYLTERCTIPINCLDSNGIMEDDYDRKEIIKALVNNMFAGDEWPQEVFTRISEKAYKTYSLKRDEFYNKGKQYVDNYLNYGAPTWYEWCTKNWGTKWNASGTSFFNNNEIQFETAWCTPMPVIVELSKMYPELEVELSFIDEEDLYGDGEYTCIILKNGEQVN